MGSRHTACVATITAILACNVSVACNTLLDNKAGRLAPRGGTGGAAAASGGRHGGADSGLAGAGEASIEQGGSAGESAARGGQAGATEMGGGPAGGIQGGSPGGAGASAGATGESGASTGGTPSAPGCSDGTREGFVDGTLFPDIAGCRASWDAQSMRNPATGSPCGFGLARCGAPEDACAEGWHVCANPPYAPSDITGRVTLTQCLEQPGRFAAAVGDRECEPCDPGFGAACCGDGCIQQNGNCLWGGQTAWFGVVEGHTNACGDTSANFANEGVMCCRD